MELRKIRYFSSLEILFSEALSFLLGNPPSVCAQYDNVNFFGHFPSIPHQHMLFLILFSSGLKTLVLDIYLMSVAP